MDGPGERRQPATVRESRLIRAVEESLLDCLLAVPKPFTSRSRAELEVAFRGFADSTSAGGERPRRQQLPRNPLWLRLWTRGVILGVLVFIVGYAMSYAGLANSMGTLLFQPRPYLMPLVAVWYTCVYTSMVVSAPVAAAIAFDNVYDLYSFAARGEHVGLYGRAANPDSALDRTAAALVLPAIFILGTVSLTLWPFGLVDSGLKAAGALTQPQYATYIRLYNRVIEGSWRILLTAGLYILGKLFFHELSQPTPTATPVTTRVQDAAPR